MYALSLSWMLSALTDRRFWWFAPLFFVLQQTAFLSFINKSPSPFHAVHETIAQLSAAGFKPLREEESWKDAIVPGGKYYVTRNQSAIVRTANTWLEME